MQRDNSRLLVKQNAVLEYGEFTKTADGDCTYFRNLLLSDAECSEESSDKCELENFVLNVVFPLSIVGSIIRSSRIVVLEDRLMVPTDGRPKGITEFVAGSRADGLSLPEMIHIVGDKFYTGFPDMDIKLVFEDFIVDPKRKGAFAVPEQGDSSPGYTFLIYNRPITDHLKDLDPDLFLIDDKFIDRSKLNRILSQYLKVAMKNKGKEMREFSGKDGYLPNVQFSQHGPATTVDIVDPIQHLRHSKDYVISLPCPKWPKQAAEWPQRRRVWPTMGIVRKVVKEGCHIILKGSKQRCDNREFLYSFSMCERTIAQSLSSCQKRSYILMKYIFKYFIDRIKRGLTTYMCKTVLFWVCENTPASKWTESNPYESLKWLLEALADYLRQGCLPNYFIPENNMILHMSKRAVTACLTDVEKALENSWRIVLQATESHRFCWLSRDISLVDLLFPIIHDDSLTRHTLQQATLRFVGSLLDAGEFNCALSILCGTWAPEVILDTIQYIRRIQKIIKNVHNHDVDHWIWLRGLLAVLYHQKSREALKAYNDHEFFENEYSSLDTFMDIVGDVGRHIWIIGAFYNLLCTASTPSHKQILRHFFTCLHGSKRNERGRLYEPEIYTNITKINMLTTYPFNLDIGAGFPFNYDVTNAFVVPSTAYILFKVVMAYKDLAKQAQCIVRKNALLKESKKVFLHLYKWKKQKCTLFPEIRDEHLCCLVGLAASAVGETGKRQTLYKEAMSYELSYSYIIHESESDEEIQGKDTENRDIALKRKIRAHPYTRKKKGVSQKCCCETHVLEYTFRGGEIPGQSFTHN